MNPTISTVVWFFWVLSLGGVDMKEQIGQWDNRGSCEEYRLTFVQSHLTQNIPISTSMCIRFYMDPKGR